MAGRRKLRICLAASSGGHMVQLLKLTEAWREYDTFCVTTTDVVRSKLETYGRVYIVGESNRRRPLRLIRVFWKCLKIFLAEKCDVVISTGAAAGCITCFLAKLTGAKVVWLDSITNVAKLSLSGRLVRPIADLFLVQWPKLADKYKNVRYAGAVI